MTSAATLKHLAIEDAITLALNPAGTELAGGWSVYEQPADVVSLPACVLDPGSPYREPTTFRGADGSSQERVRLVAHLLVRRDGHEALFQVNEAADRVLAAVDDVVGYSVDWGPMSLAGVAAINGIEAWDYSIELSVV